MSGAINTRAANYNYLASLGISPAVMQQVETANAQMDAVQLPHANTLGDSLLAGVGGAAGGALTGAAIGSIIPGLGTAAGAIIGGILGGLLGGGATALSDHNTNQQVDQIQQYMHGQNLQNNTTLQGLFSGALGG